MLCAKCVYREGRRCKIKAPAAKILESQGPQAVKTCEGFKDQKGRSLFTDSDGRVR